jgi:hypothetical protein
VAKKAADNRAKDEYEIYAAQRLAKKEAHGATDWARQLEDLAKRKKSGKKGQDKKKTCKFDFAL